jgi:ketosteroid isomerase-like protein
VISGLQPSDRLFIDGTPMRPPDAHGGWTVQAGSHYLKLMDGSQELFADSRAVKPDGTIIMARSDFKAPASVASDEQIAWNRAEQDQDVAGFADFIRKYPNSARRHQAETELENLYWLKAFNAGTAAAYRDFLSRYSSPQDAHYEAANSAIDQLDWQALQNSSDVSQISSFLARHPKGAYHDLAASRLDDLAWNAAKTSGKADALKNYTSNFPAGRHRDEANTELALLNPKPQEKPLPEPPSVRSPPSPPSENDKDAIRRTLDDYQDAYESRSLSKLRAVWPAIDSNQAKGLDQMFQDCNQIHAPYSISGGPEIKGNAATVRVIQYLDATGKRGHFKTSSKVTISLEKEPDGKWLISSVR